MFLEQLRNNTASLHKALEQTPISVKLLSANVTAEDYALYLEKLYGFLVVFDELIFPKVQHLFPGTHTKSHLIEADLIALGRNINNKKKISKEIISYQFETVEDAIGGLYVLEGSTLGGMVIHKHLFDKLGEHISGSTNYLTVYGNQTGSTWKAFIDRLNEAALQYNQEDIIGGAKKTFAILHDWMTEKIA